MKKVSLRKKVLSFLLVPLVFLGVPTPSSSGQAYEFTQDWFTHYIAHWERCLAEFTGKPKINYLKVGVYEGRSLVWMLENVLTDPTSKATAIDPFFSKEIEDRYYGNLEKSGVKKKVKTI